MANRIICIGRQFGSGGHEIAVRTGEKLGIKVYEKDLFLMACKYGEIEAKVLEGADERATNPLLYRTVHEGNHHVTRGLPTSEVLFSLQSHEIRRFARKESCIFVGRCADYVLRQEDVRMLRVFVKAPFDWRVERKMAQEDLSQGKARRLVRDMDKQRSRYYEHYTDRTWGAARNYDLVIDTSEVSIARASELLAALYKTL